MTHFAEFIIRRLTTDSSSGYPQGEYQAHDRIRQLFPPLPAANNPREYVKPTAAEYEAKMRSQVEKELRRKAKALGYELVPQTAPATEPRRAAAYATEPLHGCESDTTARPAGVWGRYARAGG